VTEPAADLVPVHLLQLPVPLAARAQQHHEELMREFALLSAGPDDAEAHVPRRLLDLVHGLSERFSGFGDAPRGRLQVAIARGDDVIDDHVLELPREAGPASQALAASLDEAEDFCRRGRHLLTLAAPEDCVAYRAWYLSQVVGQLSGAPAVSWPDFRSRSTG
jgi:hypothetical protein